MTAPSVPLKFLKTLPITASLAATEVLPAFMKVLYEFWGFCVNGTSDVLSPGGFAPVSGVLAPSGFQSGSTTLWATGTDGRTDFADNIFHSDSANFLTLNGSPQQGQLLNKFLVTWSPDSTSTDDGIYPIIDVVDATSIRVLTECGGTRRLGNKSWFRDRTNIYYRIVDVTAAAQLGSWTDGSGLVLQFNDAPTVNAGQATSQVKISLRGSQLDLGLTVSPSGSWDGYSFTDAATEMSGNWIGSSGYGAMSLIAGRDSLLCNLRGGLTSWGWTASAHSSGFHIEVPTRLYSASLDPNPVAFNMWSQVEPSQLSTNYTNMHMVGHDGTLRPWITLARCPWGTHIDTAITAVSGGIWQGFNNATPRWIDFNRNVFSELFVTSDAVLASAVGGEFSLARARLRRVRFTSNNQYTNFRYGDTDWVFLTNGVLWPWDNTTLGMGLQREGIL